MLGKGAFGKVVLGMHKVAESLVAIKSMTKETLQEEADVKRRTMLEVGILKQCNHPSVVKLYDSFETNKHICFVMELCAGGDLFSYVKRRRRLSEQTAQYFFRQILEGLAYLHNAHRVIHRDIKLENLLLDGNGRVKIGDFGVSRQLKSPTERMSEQCGTPAYIAPEIISDERNYSGFKADMWSAGVCLYAMLIGTVPFKASTISVLHALIKKGDFTFQLTVRSLKPSLENSQKVAESICSAEV